MSAKNKISRATQRLGAPAQPEPPHDQIALCARAIWEAEGCPQGRELEHWLLAEARLRQGCQAEAATVTRGRSRRSARNGSERKQSDAVVL